MELRVFFLGPDSEGYPQKNVAVMSQMANPIKIYATSPSQLRQVADWMEKIQAQW